MRFVVDAHLPRNLCAVLARHGHEAIHTHDLPDQNRTPDRAVNEISLREQRVVVSKDTDFYYSHLLHGRPWRLLLVRTGNIGAKELCSLVERNLGVILAAFATHTLVEIDRAAVRPVV